jgi:hypothetical protein
MPTMTNPTMSRAGQPGHSLYTEYRRARYQNAVMRRERLARNLPRAALRAAPLGLVFGLLFTFGLHLPVAGVVAFLVFFLGWPALVAARAYDPVPDIEALREGALAERTVARTLSRLRRHGFIVLHDRSIPGSEATIGQLLVGPCGVVVVASDPRKGIVRYVKSGAQVDGDTLKPAIDRTAYLGVEVKNQLVATLPAVKIPVYKVLVMAEASVLWSDGALDGVTIISIKDVVGYLRNKKANLSPSDVKKVAAAAERLFPAFSTNRLAEHITVDRDQWLGLMDALRTIRERDGDATDPAILERLRQIENELARQADLTGRAGMPLAVTGDDSDASANPGDDLMAPVTNLASAAARPARRGRRRAAASARAPRKAARRDTAQVGDDSLEPGDR